MERPAIISLTGLRFYAAALIVFAHTVGFYFQDDTPPHFLNGAWRVSNLGMTLFFVLSGFVIHYNYGTLISTFKISGLRSFFAARIARLYPLYLFALAIDLIQHGPDTFGSETFGNVWPYYLTLTQDWLPLKLKDARLSEIYIGSAWSISAELFLYAVYLVAARPLRRLGTPRRIIFAMVVLAVAATALQISHSALYWPVPKDDRWWFYLSPLCRIPEFMLGALCAELLVRRPSHPPNSLTSRWAFILPAIAFTWIVGVYALAGIPALQYYLNTFQQSWGFAPPSAMLIYFFARYRTPLAVLVENKFALLLGDASYSLYLLHPWIIWLFAHQHVPTGGFAYFRIGVTWMMIGLLSLGSYQFFEVPARSGMRRLLNARHPSSHTRHGWILSALCLVVLIIDIELAIQLTFGPDFWGKPTLLTFGS